MTLAHYLQHSHVNEALKELVLTIANSCATIAQATRSAATSHLLGEAQSANPQGEVQKKLDLFSNQVLSDALNQSAAICGWVSEEEDTLVLTPHVQAPFLVLFDPLDGSSNTEVNAPIGSIFSILPRLGAESITLADVLQPGRRQVAAGYAIYGPQTLLVLSFGEGVKRFALDPQTQQWQQLPGKFYLPEDTQEFAINMANWRHWDAPIRQYIEELCAGSEGIRGQNFNMRWVASMVADVHRILSRGGIFLYPADCRPNVRAGRLRLLYEANPMAFLTEQAGGSASTGNQPLLDVCPSALHQRIPVILGSKNEVARIVGYYRQQS